MFKNAGIIAFTVGCHFLLAAPVFAERAPLTAAELIDESDLVVVGEITSLEIETERSYIENGFGNYDWAIYLTLRISNVEKGVFEQSTVVVRCFRIKSRRSMMEYLTPSGNHPIPGVGANVRAHLYKNDGLWRVVFPNGLASLSEDVKFTEPDVIQRLRSRTYTYLLPLELWIAIAVIGLLLLIVFIIITRFRRHKLIARHEKME